MQVLELVLILLACVMASAVLDQIVSRVSMPLIQILVGFLVTLVMPELADIHVEGEFFLLLFIAPLLFNEARESDRKALWNNKWSILSLAVGLVLVTVLIVGFTLNWLVPSIPLAAAFALGAALGPTDAAAVVALGSTVKLTDRQKSLLSGEALINDASGVVSFNFAIAAAVTATFSLLEATVSFLWLFFGGILIGLVLGAVFAFVVRTLRRRGLASTTVSVLFEVFTPFVVFLAAEHLSASGVLAVVAAGIVMQQKPRFGVVSADFAEQQMVSQNVWKVGIFLINGVLFVMLGMQLPTAMDTELRTHLSFAAVIGLIVLITFLVLGTRFVWVWLMEMSYRSITGKDFKGKRAVLKNVLITTVGGPKGAITLSLILTIPLTLDSGEDFPSRRLLIFLAAGVILLTLLIADFLMPRLARQDEKVIKTREDELHRANVTVLETTIRDLQARIADSLEPEYTPAARLTLARYRVRLTRELFNSGKDGGIFKQLSNEVIEVQQHVAEELRKNGEMGLATREMYASFPVLRGVTALAASFGHKPSLKSRWLSLKRRVTTLIAKLRHEKVDEELLDLMYYDTCVFAIRLEEAAIEFLAKVKEGDSDKVRARAAGILLGEHKSSLNSLKGRIKYAKEQAKLASEKIDQTEDGKIETSQELKRKLEATARNPFGEQFKKTYQYIDEMEATAYSIELAEINRLRALGEISESVAHTLRQNVYLMQMALSE